MTVQNCDSSNGTASSSGSDDLSWSATQYVLGELSDSDTAAFESRMEHDLAACEAVAEATLLVMALREATHSVSSIVSRSETVGAGSVRWKQRPQYPWLFLSCAASLAFSAVVWFLPIDSSKDQTVHRDLAAFELVSRWRIGSEIVSADSDEAEFDSEEAEPTVDVPDWLLAAVSLEEIPMHDAALPVESKIESKDN